MYMKHEMLAQAQAAGYKITQSLFEDWIDKGIVGKSVKRQYPGRGSVAFWSHRQLELLVAALKQRKQYHATVTDLCNLPVWAWLYFGEEMEVPLAQVQTAMTTWVHDVRVHSIRSTRKSLQELVDLIQSPHATDRRAFVEALTNHEEIAEEDLKYYLQNIIDPKHRGEGRGPRRASFTVDSVKNMIAVRAQAMKQLEKTPDSLWEWARAFLQFTMGQYCQDQPEFAADPDQGLRQ